MRPLDRLLPEAASTALPRLPATRRSRPAPAAALRPPELVAGDAEWEELLLSRFGPRHWNLGCG